MFKKLWKFSVVYMSIFGLLSTSLYALTPEEAQRQVEAAQAQAKAAAIEATNTVNQNTGVSKDALTSGDVRQVTQEQINQAKAKTPTAHQVSSRAQQQLEAAKADLDAKKAVLADVQSGLNHANIKQKEAALAQALSACPGYDTEYSSGCPSSSRDAINRAQQDLKLAKIPNYDYEAIQRAQNEVKAAEQTFIQAGHEAQYGAQTAAGAEAIVRAAQEIDASIKDEFKKDAAGNTKADGILEKIKKSTTKTDLQNTSRELGTYRAQLQQDVAMVIIGQVTSRLTACSSAPDLQLGIGAGQAFIVGEVAEYAQAEFLKAKLEESLKDLKSGPYDKQLETLRTLRSEYKQVLVSAQTKQRLRSLSQTAFYDAAALAAAEAVENETWAVACTNENINMVSRGSNQGGDNIMMYLAMAAAAYAIPYCGGCAAAAIYLMMKKNSEDDKNSCEAGGKQTEQRMIDRKIACDTLGTEAMFNTPVIPTTTASSVIKAKCLADGDAVNAGVGQGCQRYSSNGAGPYSSCDKASDAYRRNMVSCPLSVLSAGKVATLETSGVTSEEGKEFVRKASEEVSRTVDLRIASPRHRIIVWTAFGELANNAVNTNKAMLITIQTQLDKIQRIIDSLEAEAKGATLGKASTTGANINTPDIITSELAIKFNNATSCMTGTGKECQSPSSVLKSISGFNNLPFDLKTSTTNVASGLDSINNTKGLTSGNMASIDAANRENASIRNILNKKKTQLQSLTVKSENKIDIDKESDLLHKNLNKTVSNAIGKNNYGQSGSGPSTSPSVTQKDSSDLIQANKNNNGQNFDNFSAFGSQSTGISLVKTSNAGPTETKSSETVDTGLPTNIELADAIAARNRAGKDKYKSSDEQTIFEKVTNAYIRNYDKVLIRKKEKDLDKEIKE